MIYRIKSREWKIFVGAFIGIAVGFLLIGLINGWDSLKWFLDEIFHRRR